MKRRNPQSPDYVSGYVPKRKRGPMPGIRSARRRVRTRTALLLSLSAMAGMLLMGFMGWFLPPVLRVWQGMAATLLGFALPAYVGLCYADGDQRSLLLLRRLSGAQVLWISALGALMVCPVTLLADVITAILLKMAGPQAALAVAVVAGADGMALLLPMLLASGLIAPLFEELFFRGYVMGAFKEQGAVRAGALSALLFALCHGLGVNTPGYVLLGLVFAAVMQRTQSLFAAVLAHMMYNMTLVLLASTPFAALFAGLSPVGVMLRLIGCAGLCAAVKRAWTARGVGEGKVNLKLKGSEKMLIVIALLLVIAAQAVQVLTAGGTL